MDRKSKIIIGLMGGVGSGKSTVARILASLGAEVIDADEVALSTYGYDDVREKVKARFGEGVFLGDGSIDRKTLGAIVFADKAALFDLNAIVHPKTLELMVQRVDEFRAGENDVLVLDVSLLAESGMKGVCDSVWFVKSRADSRRERVKSRGWSESEVETRENLQTPLAVKESMADTIIDNDGSREELQRAAAANLARLKEHLFPTSPSSRGQL
ncbi:MAG: dephospho-CoA kinase [Planctomycetes bacterium]|nr:dephospho-CoA kinase [Planctomycetota bacterium]